MVGPSLGPTKPLLLAAVPRRVVTLFAILVFVSMPSSLSFTLSRNRYTRAVQDPTMLAASESMVHRRVCQPLLAFVGTRNSLQHRKKKTSSEKKKILIILADTGGGHKASGQAIAAALQDLYPNKLEFEIVDIWTDHAGWPWCTAIKWYQVAAKHPLIWKLMFEFAAFPPTNFFNLRHAALVSYDKFHAFFEESDPDMVISVHPCCQHLPLRVVNDLYGGSENRRASLPFVTVVTDLGGCSPLWMHKKVDVFYVPSDTLEGVAKRHGFAQDQLRKYGLPIRPGFQALGAKEKKALREKLGFHQDARTALVVGGGDGVGKIGNIAKELSAELSADGGGLAQLIIVCAKNEKLKAKLEAEKWPDNVVVSIKGFVSNMDELMGAADCIITKAGPGTIAEACASGLPIMLSDFLPGQEWGNIPLVVDGGFGSYSSNPKTIAKTVSGWFKDPELLATMSAKSRDFGRPEATMAIAKDLGELLFPEGRR